MQQNAAFTTPTAARKLGFESSMPLVTPSESIRSATHHNVSDAAAALAVSSR